MSEQPAHRIQLREVRDSDLPHFFAHQRDEEANWMAAFTVTDPHDETAFQARWDKIAADEQIVARTILYDGRVAGNVTSFVMFGWPSVGYWLGREFWGRGIATHALRLFLAEVTTRPLVGRVAADNHASRRVLEKCGFVVAGRERGFANARGAEIEELVLVLV